MYAEIGASRESAPPSAATSVASAVRGLESDATQNAVVDETGAPRRRSATPRHAVATEPPALTPTATPGSSTGATAAAASRAVRSRAWGAGATRGCSHRGPAQGEADRRGSTGCKP